jgi:hypothetical protein
MAPGAAGMTAGRRDDADAMAQERRDPCKYGAQVFVNFTVTRHRGYFSRNPVYKNRMASAFPE